jgi:CheY-like chemotaxis protein
MDDHVSLRPVVLCIEDDAINLRLMKLIFEQRPAIRLVIAVNGRLGLELAREDHPDLILLDLQLPDMSGDEVLIRLRQDPDLRHTPVLVVSAQAYAEDVERLMAAGVQGYVTKPIDVAHFLVQLDAVLPPRFDGRLEG